MNTESNFCFNHHQFSKLFPFYILINQEGQIASFGESIGKICAIEKGGLFSNAFKLKRPSTDFNLNDLDSIIDQIIIIESRFNSKLVLRGQFEYTEHKENVFFIGTPWFGSMDQIVENQLSIDDFAKHDSMIDLLHVLKTQEITTNEIKELLKKVNLQKTKITESEKRISSLVLNLQTGVLLEDETRHIALCNKMFCDLFQIPVPPESLIGLDCSNAAEQSKSLFKDPEGFVIGITELLINKNTKLSEHLEMADGRILERDYIPIFVLGVYKGHLWKYTDVTTRFKYEENLKKQEAKYRSIIENIKLGLLEVNLKDEIQYANQNFCEISGYKLPELLNKKAHETLLMEDTTQIIEEKNAMRMRGVSDSYELAVKNKKGEDRWWLISGAPNYNDRGELIGSIGIHLDITEQKFLQQELLIAKQRAEESSKAKESFLANMSHEIRTPLNAIIGMVRELLKMSQNATQSQYLTYAQSASQHLLSIINNILDISKIEAGELKLDKQTFNLNRLIDDVLAMAKPMTKDKSLDIVVSLSDDLARAHVGDPNRIRQILLNILSNSIKFTEKGKISLTCHLVKGCENSQEILLSIADTGIGMDANYLKTIFKKFSQEDLSIVRKYGGTGLGMAITNELIQLMGGRIEVTSEKGVGSTFTIFLNLEIQKNEEELKVNDTIQNIELRNVKILLVEDNELNRLVATNSLNYHHALVTEAINGKEAVEILKSQRFDLILMDLQMPEMDGLEATRIIRNELKITTPMIALTANALKNEIEKCMEVGMNDYVTKPFEEKHFLQVVTKNCNLKMITKKSQPMDIEIKDIKKQYDLVKIIELSHGNDSFVQKMSDLFCTNMKESVNELKHGFQANDYPKIKSVAHRMKPMIDNMCIHSLTQDIRDLESINIDTLDTLSIASQLDKLEKIIMEVITDLSSKKN